MRAPGPGVPVPPAERVLSRLGAARHGPDSEASAPSAWGVVAVLVLHLLVLWGLHEATHRPAPRVAGPSRAVHVTWLTEAETVPAAAPRPARSSPAAAPRRPREAQARTVPPSPFALNPPSESVAPSPHPSTAPDGTPQADAPIAAAPPASAPLLDSPASRRAIRELAREKPITEQAALASDTTPTAPGARLGERIREAGKGDCAKGEYFGGGMGLLSLPFLAAAAIRDQCAQ
ncbi:MAG TPA: hypothetical protein VFL86_21095 [Burkholderiaceae bacterium]|nr:hypothetical protein [Burkholderiaceae bacterium]